MVGEKANENEVSRLIFPSRSLLCAKRKLCKASEIASENDENRRRRWL